MNKFRELKKLKDKLEIKRFIKELISKELSVVEQPVIQGQRGEHGEKGEKGDKGENGRDGKDGKKR